MSTRFPNTFTHASRVLFFTVALVFALMAVTANAQFEILSSGSAVKTVAAGGEVTQDATTPTGAQVLFLAVSAGAREGTGIEVTFASCGFGTMRLVAGTDPWNDEDQLTNLYYYRSAALETATGTEFEVGVDSEDQDPVNVTLSWFFVRGFDLTLFPPQDQPYTGYQGRIYSSTLRSAGELSLQASHALGLGDYVLTSGCGYGSPGAPIEAHMAELCRGANTVFAAPSALSSFVRTDEAPSFSWSGTVSRGALLALPLRASHFGSLKVNILPEEAVAQGAQWRLPGGDWQDSGALLGGIPAGSWDIEVTTLPGFSALPLQVDVAPDAMTEATAQYHREGTPEVLSVSTYAEVASIDDDAHLIYFEGDIHKDTELMLITLAYPQADDTEVTFLSGDLSAFEEHPAPTLWYDSGNKPGWRTRVYFMTRPQLNLSGYFELSLKVSPLTGAEWLPFMISATCLQGVDLTAFSGSWDETPYAPDIITLSGAGPYASFEYAGHERPLNGDATLALLWSPEPVTGPDDGHELLWNMSSYEGDPAGPAGLAAGLRRFEAGGTDNLLGYEVGGTDQPWELALLSLPAAGRGSLAIGLNDAYIGAPLQWRFDGGPWYNSEASAPEVAAGYHTVEFLQEDDGLYQAPPPREVYVHRSTPELYRMTYSKLGVPHVIAQRSFDAPLSSAGILTARISPALEQTAEFAVVQITAPERGFIDEVYLDTRKMEKWVASPTGQPYAALFYLKAPAITSSSTLNISAEEKSGLDTMVHVGLLLMRNVSDSDIYSPYSNVTGVRVDNGLANILNPLEYDGIYDVLCGTLIMASPVSQAYTMTDPASNPGQVWSQESPGKTSVGYTAMATPSAAVEQQGAAWWVGASNTWAGAEALIYAARATITVTISPAGVPRTSGRWQLMTDTAWRLSGNSAQALCGRQPIKVNDIVGWKIANPDDLWVDVQKGVANTKTITFTPIATTRVVVNFGPVGTDGQLYGAWRIKGRSPEDAWKGDGVLFSSFTGADIERGSVEIEFKDVSGFSTPETCTVAITEGQTTALNVRYIRWGELRFTVLPAEVAQNNTVRWNIEGQTAWHVHTERVDVDEDIHTVQFSAVPGWRAPVVRIRTYEGVLTEATVRYEPWGTPRVAAQSSWSGDMVPSASYVDVPISAPEYTPDATADLAVMMVTWQHGTGAPTLYLDGALEFRLWKQVAHPDGAVSTALYYRKNPVLQGDPYNDPEPVVRVQFGGSGNTFTLQTYCLFLNEVNLDYFPNPGETGTLPWTASSFGTASPNPANTSSKLLAGMYLGLVCTGPNGATPSIASAPDSEERFLEQVWRGQALAGKVTVAGSGNLVTGKVYGSSHLLDWFTIPGTKWVQITSSIPAKSGSLQVTITPPEAVAAGVQWQADPGQYFSNSGDTRTDASLGENRLSHNHINGWEPVNGEDVATVAPNILNTYTYAFRQVVRGGVRVTLYPDALPGYGAQWKIAGDGFETTWQSSGVSNTDAPYVNTPYTILCKPVTGWAEPEAYPVTLRNGTVEEISLLYKKNGSLKVTLKPSPEASGAQYWFFEGETERRALTGQRIDNVRPGTYTLYFTDIPGWMAPIDNVVIIGEGQAVETTLYYEKTPQAGIDEFGATAAIQVSIEPEEARLAGGRWRIEGSDWRTSGYVQANLPSGYYQVLLQPLEGWYASKPYDIVALAGDTVQKTVYYTPAVTFDFQDTLELRAEYGGQVIIRVTVPAGVNPDTLTYTIEGLVTGEIDFNAAEGLFTYTPSAEDYTPFRVTFCVEAPGGGSLCNDVVISPRPALGAEEQIIQNTMPLPNEEDAGYATITARTSSAKVNFNYEKRFVRDVIVSAKRLRISAGSALHNMLHDAHDLRSLKLYAETLVIAAELKMPGTSVDIYARNLEFEGDTARIDLTPPDNPEAAEDAGATAATGMACPRLQLFVESLVLPGTSKRFILKGGRGQTGAPGSKGEDGGTFPPAVSISSLEGYIYSIVGDEADKFKNNVVYYNYAFSTEDMTIYGQNGTKAWANESGPTTPRGKPGTGGNGGILNMPFNLGGYSDRSGGPGGNLYPVTPGQAAPHVPNPAYWLWAGDKSPSSGTTDRDGNPPVVRTDAHGRRIIYVEQYDRVWQRGFVDATPGTPGPSGTLGVVPAMQRGWVVPETVQPVLMYLRDVYLNGHLELAQGIATEYIAIINRRLTDLLPPDVANGLQAQRDELIAILNRLESGLDYFGNPPGWTPMLSFESNYTFFQNAYKQAIPTLYLAEWWEADESRRTFLAEALTEARQQNRNELATLRRGYDNLVLGEQQAHLDVANLNNRIRDVNLEIARLEAKLRAQAEEQAKVPWWKQALNAVSAVCKIIPVPAVQAVGVGASVLDALASGDTGAAVTQAKDFAKVFEEEEVPEKAEELNAEVQSENPEEVDSEEDAVNYFDIIKGKAEEAMAAYKAVSTAASEQKVPKDRVDAILNELKSKDRAFQALCEKVDALTKERTRVEASLSPFAELKSSLTSQIGNTLMALVKTEGSIADPANQPGDHVARQYFKDLNQRVRHRLLQYQYYMAKAYEFRTLQPYPAPGGFQIQRFFDAILANPAFNPADRETPVLSSSEQVMLETPFREELSDILETFIQMANESTPSRATDYTLLLSEDSHKDLLDELNRNRKVTINLKRLGAFPAYHENQRLANITVGTGLNDLQVNYTGTDPNATLRINYTHSGVSRFRSGGKTYLFRHFNEENENTIQWETTYTHYTQTWSEDQPDPTTASLLSLVLDKPELQSSGLYYCTPSAWADIEIRLDNPDFEVTHMYLTFDIYYKPKSPNVVDLYINSPDDFTPLIQVNVANPGTLPPRQDGFGEFHRQFSKTTPTTVTLTAEEDYGLFHFAGWRSNGKMTPAKPGDPSITVYTDREYTLEPLYEPDPVTVPKVTGHSYTPRNEPPSGEYSVDDYSEAEFRLLMYGLELGTVRYERTGNTEDKDLVLRQYPEEGVTAAMGSKVHVVVSSGNEDPAGDDFLEEAMAGLLEGFDTFDTNGDGSLSWEEASAAWPDLWPEDFDTLDTDGNNLLSPEELGYVPPLCAIESREAVFRLLLLLSHEDVSGVLTKAQFQTVLNAPTAAMNNWNQLDLDSDNAATIEEFEASAWTYLNNLFAMDVDLDNALSLAEFQAVNSSYPAGDFNYYAALYPPTDVIGCEELLDVYVLYAPDIPHPADKNTDWRIVLPEAIGYLAGWQQGSNPIGYAIRAAYLWQNGEHYRYNSDVSEPLCWELVE